MENKNDNYYEEVSFDFEALDECPICGNKTYVPNGRIDWLGIDFWYVICPSCGLKFMNPRPTKNSYQDFYKNKFWEQKVRNIGFHKKGQTWQSGTYKWDNDKKWDPKEGKENRMQKHKEQRVKTIVPVIDEAIKINKDSDILEMGAGFGVTLNEIHKQYGANVYAIEPSDEGVETMTKEGNIKVIGRYAEELEEFGKEEQKFDAIVFSHILENTVDPLFVIKCAKECLKEKGIIYIQTPNLLVFDQMNPYHPFIFCSNSLRILFEKAGMTFKQVSKTIDRMLIAVCHKR